MRACEIKSTGTLVDELLTTDLKIAAGNTDAQERRHELGNTIIERTAVLIVTGQIDKYREFQRVTEELRTVLKQCWDAQETVSRVPLLYDEEQFDIQDLYKIAHAGKEAQRTNRLRNQFIRRLDEIVGETDRTQLEKTYGKG